MVNTHLGGVKRFLGELGLAIFACGVTLNNTTVSLTAIV